MILDVDAVAQLPSTLVELINDEDRRHRLSANIKDMALTSADEKIVDKVYEIVAK